MKVIKYDNAIKGENSDTCKTLEYNFNDNHMDLGIAEIIGRYPNKGYCVNLRSKELIYVVDGEGTLNFIDKEVKFEKGDAILIEANEKYYWQSNYCVVSMTCTPPWNEEQHKIIE